MGLFRPYEQGETKTEKARSSRSARSTSETVEAEAVPEAAGDSSSPTRITRAGKHGSGRKVANRKKVEARKADEQPTDQQGIDHHDGGTPRTPKKGRPTPTRAEAEAARRQRLNPSLSPKEARRRDRQVRQEKRVAAMEAAERRPERALIRDYADSRWTVSEFIMPVFLIVMAAWLVVIMFIPSQMWIVNMLSLVMLLVMVGWLLDSWRLWRGIKRELDEHYPQTPRRGLLSYLNNRIMTPRRWRNPAPRVERGAHRR